MCIRTRPYAGRSTLRAILAGRDHIGLDWSIAASSGLATTGTARWYGLTLAGLSRLAATRCR